MSQNMVQRKPNTRLEICKAFQDRLTFLNRHMIVYISLDFVKFTENIEAKKNPFPLNRVVPSREVTGAKIIFPGPNFVSHELRCPKGEVPLQ